MLNNSFFNIPITRRAINPDAGYEEAIESSPVITQRAIQTPQQEVIGNILNPLGTSGYLQPQHPNSVVFNDYNPNLQVPQNNNGFLSNVGGILNSAFFPAAQAEELSPLNYGSISNIDNTGYGMFPTSDGQVEQSVAPILRERANIPQTQYIEFPTQPQIDSGTDDTPISKTTGEKFETIQFTEDDLKKIPSGVLESSVTKTEVLQTQEEQNINNYADKFIQRYTSEIDPLKIFTQSGYINEIADKYQADRATRNELGELVRANRVAPDINSLSAGQLVFSPLKNAALDLGEYGTGIVSSTYGLLAGVAADLGLPVDEQDAMFSKQMQDAMDYWFWGSTPKQKAEDIYNFAFGTLFNSNDYKNLKASGNLNPATVLGTMFKNFYMHPVGSALDILTVAPVVSVPIKLAKGVTFSKAASVAKTVDNANKIAGKPSKLAQIATDVTRARVAQEIDKSATLIDSLKNANTNDLARVIKAAEEGLEVPANLQNLKNTLKSFSKNYHELVLKFAPYNAVNPKIMATTQYVARKLGTTFDDARRLLAPYFENAEYFKYPYAYKEQNAIKQLYDHITGITGLPKPEIERRFGKLQRVWKEGFKAGDKHALAETVGDKIIFYKGAIKNSKAPVDLNQVLRHELTHKDTLWLQNLSMTNDGAFEYFKNLKRALGKDLETDGVRKLLDGLDNEAISYAMDKLVDPNVYIPSDVAERVTPKLLDFMRSEYFDVLPNGNPSLTAAAKESFKSGNEVEKLLVKAEEAFDKGNLYPITHVNAEELGTMANFDANFAGRFSQRMVGQATYEDIAKALKKPDTWLENTLDSLTESNLLGQIAEGLVSPTEGGKNIVYASIDDIKKAKRISDIPLQEQKPLAGESVALDKKVLERIEDRLALGRGDNPFKHKLLADLWKTGKNVMLGTGLYLSGNIGTAAANTLLDSNINILRNIAQAQKTGGKLARLTGVRQPMIRGKQNISDLPILKQIDLINMPIRDAWSSIDKMTQNFTAEVALHNRLAKEGVPFANRAEYLKQIANTDKVKLADIIEDTARVAAMPAKESIIPKPLRGAVALGTGQFWGWMEDAARSSIHMTKKHPILSNMIYHHILGELGYNQELQHRLGIRADLEKPFVHMKINPKTGGFREVHLETSPQMNTVKVSAGVLGAMVGDKNLGLQEVGQGASLFLNTMINASKGLDKYGRPIQRYSKDKLDKTYIDQYSKKRYKWVQGQGLVPLEAQADEMITAALSNLISGVNLVNSTVMPTIGAITGQSYFRPAANRLFGSFDPNADIPLLEGSDPSKEVLPTDIITRFLGGFPSESYDDNSPVTGRNLRRIIRSGSKRDRLRENIRRQYR